MLEHVRNCVALGINFLCMEGRMPGGVDSLYWPVVGNTLSRQDVIGYAVQTSSGTSLNIWSSLLC